MPQEKYSCSIQWQAMLKQYWKCRFKTKSKQPSPVFHVRHISAAILQQRLGYPYNQSGRIPKNQTALSWFSAWAICHAKPQQLVSVEHVWPWPGKNTEQLQLSGSLEHTPTSISSISSLMTFSSGPGSESKAGRKKSDHHKEAAVWRATFFFFDLNYFSNSASLCKWFTNIV